MKKTCFNDFETLCIIYRYTFSLCLHVKLVLKGVYKIELNEKEISFCKSVRYIYGFHFKLLQFYREYNSFDYA